MCDHEHAGGRAKAWPASISVWVRPMGWLLFPILALWFFPSVSTVALGVLAACIIASTLKPLMAWIPGPRGVDIAVIGLGLIAVLALVVFSLSWPLASPISDAVSNWPQTKLQINQTLQNVSHRLSLEQNLDIDDLLRGLRDFLLGSNAGAFFSKSADLILGIMISLAFTLVGSMFLLSEPSDRLIASGLGLVSEQHRPAMRAALDDLGPRYRRWVIGTLTGMSVVFTASMIGYASIGLKFAVPLALLAGFAEIVPTVGPAVACVIAALFAGATQGGGKAVGVLVVYGIIQALEAYMILPMIMRGAVNIHPAVTLFTVVLWGKIFGVAGLMLAIPINLTIWTFLEHLCIKPSGKGEQAGEKQTETQQVAGDG